MPTRNISLSGHQDRFVSLALTTGRYQNASEVVREGLRMLERREAEDALRLDRLRAAVAEGEAALARGEYEDVAPGELEGWVADLGGPTP